MPYGPVNTSGISGTGSNNVRVRVATTANVTIATALNNGDTLDGVTLATGDLVLVKDQSTTHQNGIYVVAASPARSPLFDSYDEHPGAIVAVTEGTANADKAFICTSNAGGTLDSTAIAFTAFASGVIGGTAGSTDNLLPRADGTGGTTLQGSTITLSDTGEFAAASGTMTLTSPALVTPALGTPASGVLTSCTTATASAGDNDTSLASTAFVANSAIFKLSTTQVSTNTGTKQVLYTVPASKKCIVTSIIARAPSTSLASTFGEASTNWGFTAGADGWAEDTDNTLLQLLTASTTAVALVKGDQAGIGSVFSIGNATETFGVLFAYTGLTATVQMDVFGYLYDA